jgi:hypothetical protein
MADPPFCAVPLTPSLPAGLTLNPSSSFSLGLAGYPCALMSEDEFGRYGGGLLDQTSL